MSIAAGQTVKHAQVLDRGKGWVVDDGTTRELTGDDLAEAREEMYTVWITSQLTPLRGKEFTLTSLKAAKVGGLAAAGVRVACKGHRDVKLYFDKKSGLLVKSEATVKDAMTGGKEVTEETFFDDYKAVEGVQVPHRQAVKRNGQDFFSGEVTEAKVLQKLGDAVFAKP